MDDPGEYKYTYTAWRGKEKLISFSYVVAL